MLASLVLALLAASPASEPASACSESVETYRARTSLELAQGYAACIDEGRIDDAAFLDLLARIRFQTDIVLLTPADILSLFEQPEFAKTYTRAGDYVDENLARDPQRFDALVQRVLAADLSVSDDYQPGWPVEPQVKRHLYAAVAEGVRTDTLALERYIATLVRDDAYFEAYSERKPMFETWGEEHPPEWEARLGELQAIMEARAELIGDPPSKSAVPWREVYRPGPEAPFTALYIGFNGPADGGAAIFGSAAEVRASWLASALDAPALETLLAATDFEREIIGVYAVGEMINATENSFVTELGPNDNFSGYSLAVKVGVAGEECGFEPQISYPFLLAKAPRGSDSENEVTSSSRANFPDQCAPVVSGSAVSVDDPEWGGPHGIEVGGEFESE